MISIFFQILPDQALRFLLKIQASVEDLTRPIEEVLREVLSDAFTDVTAAKGALYGAGWMPMTYFTQWFHRRNPAELLSDKGDLAASLVPGGTDNIFEVTPMSGEAGTINRAAQYLQRGTSRTFRILQFLRTGERGFNVPGMAPRVFLDWHPENFDRYAQIFANHIEQASNG